MTPLSSDMTMVEPAALAKKGRQWLVALRWALIGLALHLAIVLSNVANWGRQGVNSAIDPAWFVRFGRESKALPLAKKTLAQANVVTWDRLGHDGQWFWVMSHDPLLLHADHFLSVVDRPFYRAQRVGYPATLFLWRKAGGEQGLLWGMVITNLIAVAVGGWVTCRLLVEIGARPWFTLAFALCPAVLFATLMDLADGLALMWVMIFLLAVKKQRWGWAIFAAVAGVLTRESTLLCVLGVGWLMPEMSRARRIALSCVSVGALLLWSAYIHARLGWPSGWAADQEVTWPLWGYVRAVIYSWRPYGLWVDAAVAIALLPLALIVLMQWWKRRDLLLSAAAPVALAIPFLGTNVLDLSCNSTRAAGPMILLWLLSLSPRRNSGP